VQNNPSYRFISDTALAAALSEAERFAIKSGPEFVDVDADYPRLPDQTGWRVSQRIDVTDVFAQSIRTSLQLMTARAALVETFGAEDYRERVKRRQVTLAGLDRRAEARDLRRDGNDDPIGVMGD
jgi:hypothetical protein